MSTAGHHGPHYRSPLLDLPGAVPATGIDAGVAEHYGDPLGEQRTLATDAAFVDRSNRLILAVTGTDRAAWLDNLLTQPMTDIPEGRTTEALILTLAGRVRFHVLVTNLPGTMIVGFDQAGQGSQLLTFLRAHQSGFDVGVDTVEPEWAILSVIGPRCLQTTGDLGLAAPPAPYDTVLIPGGGPMRRMPYRHADAVDIFVPRPLLSHTAARLATRIRPAGIAAFEAMRVEARRPRVLAEVDDTILPQEVGWMGVTVDPDKHSYLGAAARRQAAPTRRIVLLRLRSDPDTLPARHTPVTCDGQPVGRIGTAVHHYEQGPLALALVQHDVPDDAVLAAGGMPASIVPER